MVRLLETVQAKGVRLVPKGHAAVRITAVPVATAWQVERRDFSLD